MTDTATYLPLDRLVADAGLQPRVNGLDRDNVERLEASDPAEWPALVVAPLEDGRYVIIDGYHRHEAARRLQLDALPCTVAADAGYPEAVAANLRHGLPLSVEDRKTYARWLHGQEPALSYRELGKRCGLSDKTVKAALQPAGADNPQPASRQSDPIERHIKLLDQAALERVGIGLLGRDRRVQHVRAVLDQYGDDERPEIAQAVHQWGTAYVEAARPYVGAVEK